MKYIELKIHASRQGIEAVLPLLMGYGVESVSVDDPADLDTIMDKENPYEWDYIDESLNRHPDREPVLSVWLDDTDENREIVQNIKIDILKLKAEEQYLTFGPDADFGRLYVESETVDDEAWKDKWKEYFKPAKITDRIVVKPTWEAYDAKAGELVLEIDPGTAFGTGTHETTSLCMKLLEKYAANCGGEGTGNVRVIDVGCGSGILSVAAALLGCKYVLGTEIDSEAVQIARENVALNGVASQVKVLEADLLKGIPYKADIIVANLMHNLVMQLAPDAYTHLDAGGVFISSGILLEKRDQVASAVEAAGFKILEIPEDGEWCAIAAQKK
ncbi:MAG: 50S ribosomal protein L11 methyltransferase [Clostridiales bacterium]|nr:50S ribosomal protein L11 methyltransferase [Clostridiales bacterium]